MADECAVALGPRIIPSTRRQWLQQVAAAPVALGHALGGHKHRLLCCSGPSTGGLALDLRFTLDVVLALGSDVAVARGGDVRVRHLCILWSRLVALHKWMVGAFSQRTMVWRLQAALAGHSLRLRRDNVHRLLWHSSAGTLRLQRACRRLGSAASAAGGTEVVCSAVGGRVGDAALLGCRQARGLLHTPGAHHDGCVHLPTRCHGLCTDRVTAHEPTLASLHRPEDLGGHQRHLLHRAGPAEPCLEIHLRQPLGILRCSACVLGSCTLRLVSLLRSHGTLPD
mmetsp:Transcript_62841/g.161755  ORF Transcript_62841/g.161755 Transcript_62841/m.161755 type:complete len:282 (-) Transcript_62841:149-994(-)